MIKLAVIVAAAENGVIGSNNALPWHLPDDLRHFKRVTMGKPIIMGRKTFESIGHPLPGRCNIVISRDSGFAALDVASVASLAAALVLAQKVALAAGAEEAVVIGGAEIYALALPQADRLYITEVHASVPGDVLLPAIDWNQWREISRDRHAAAGENPYAYSFVVYERTNRKSNAERRNMLPIS